MGECDVFVIQSGLAFFAVIKGSAFFFLLTFKFVAILKEQKYVNSGLWLFLLIEKLTLVEVKFDLFQTGCSSQ